MSTHYGIKCEGCNVTSTTVFRREVVSEIVRLWPHIREIAGSPENWAGFKFEIFNNYDEPYVESFMKEHYEHKLLIVSEYGDVVEVAKHPGVSGAGT